MRPAKGATMSDKVDVGQLRQLMEQRDEAEAERKSYQWQHGYSFAVHRVEHANAQLLAAAVNALPQLLAAYERCARLEGALREATEMGCITDVGGEYGEAWLKRAREALKPTE